MWLEEGWLQPSMDCQAKSVQELGDGVNWGCG